MLNRRRDPQASPADAASAGAADLFAGVDAAVIDVDALRRLAELDPTGANRLLQRVFQAFESSAQRLLPQVHTALASGDLAGVRHVAHTLKSSSASIGAIKLSRLCAEIESMVRLETVDGLPGRIADMDRETTVVLQALRRISGAAT